MNNQILSKVCTSCKESKQIPEFNKNKNSKDGAQIHCKKCVKSYKEKYRKTEIGVINCIYGTQKNNSKIRNHPAPKYTKDQLTEWLYKNNFKTLYELWVLSGFLRSVKPSVDRLDDSKGYSISNIQLITTKENELKAGKDRINAFGQIGLQCKKVFQFNLDGVFIKSHISRMKASTDTKTNNSHIGECCSKKRKTAGKFMWSNTRELGETS